MTMPSFSHFQWLNRQPQWDREPDYKSAIVTARYQRWQPVWKMLFRDGFSDVEVGALLRLRDEYETNVLIKG